MEDNLEIYFCEICSESISAAELASKQSLSVKGKVIGGCCLAEIQPAAATVVAGTSPLGLTAVGAIVLAGVAAATLFLDSRLTDDINAVKGDMDKVRTSVASQGNLWEGLDKRLDATMQQGALAPLEAKIVALQQQLVETEKRVTAPIEGLGLRLNLFEDHNKNLAKGQEAVRRDIKEVQVEVLRLGRELATKVAARRPMPVGGGDVVSKPADASTSEEPGLVLPAELAAQVARLEDEDAGTRFEAVDQLILSKNPAVLPLLLGMLKDADPFVRRLTAEGLAKFKQAESVDALLATLADAESIVRHTAHGSLKKLTGQTIAFDPDGSASARSAAQRRWKDWWAKNRSKF